MFRRIVYASLLVALLGTAGCGTLANPFGPREPKPVLIVPDETGGMTISVPLCVGDEDFSVGVGGYNGVRDRGVDYLLEGASTRTETIVLRLTVDTILAGALTDQLPLAPWAAAYEADFNSVADAGLFYVRGKLFYEAVYMSDLPLAGSNPVILGLAPGTALEPEFEPTTAEAGLTVIEDWCEGLL